MAAIEIRSLTKWYGTARGIEEITFAIEPGEIFGYLGPNGSGKTTTIRCIMGLLRPSGGEVRVLGRARQARDGARSMRRIGYLPGEFRIWGRPKARRSLRILAALGGDREHSRATQGAGGAARTESESSGGRLVQGQSPEGGGDSGVPASAGGADPR